MSDQSDGNARLVELAARALAAGRPEAVPPPLGDRARTIAAIERALRARARRGKGGLWWGAASLAAAAAAAAVVWFAAGRPAGAPLAPAPLAAGARLEGPELLEMATGTRLRLLPSSSVKVVELGATQRFRLERGGLEAHVAKVGAGTRFFVETPDVEIEVKGTRFDVGVDAVAEACAPRVRTRVTVHEGLVTVRHGAGDVRLVGAGASWPTCPALPATAATTADAPAPAPSAATRTMERRGPSTRAFGGDAGRARARTDASPARAVAAPSGPPAAPAQGSTLADQNDLFAAALAAGRRGDRAEALRWLELLLRRYPDGQLVENARAERDRLRDRPVDDRTSGRGARSR